MFSTCQIRASDGSGGHLRGFSTSWDSFCWIPGLWGVLDDENEAETVPKVMKWMGMPGCLVGSEALMCVGRFFVPGGSVEERRDGHLKIYADSAPREVLGMAWCRVLDDFVKVVWMGDRSSYKRLRQHETLMGHFHVDVVKCRRCANTYITLSKFI